MELRNKKHKNDKGALKVNKRPIISILIGLGFITSILAAVMLAASQKIENKKTGSTYQAAGGAPEVTEEADNSSLAVVRKLDKKNNHITLFDIERRNEIELTYSGGTDITDKYGKSILISQVPIGSMVDYSYRQDINKLIGMNISKNAWEYAHVSNMNIDRTDQVMKIASTKYKYNDDITVLNGKKFITAEDLAEQDELTVWGYKETIWSVSITKGHGTVKLEDYKDYLGDFVSIGYESMQQITDDMEITVREGDYNLTVENRQYSATKPVTVCRNKVTYVSLKDLGPEGLKLFDVSFKIAPEGADLYIDGRAMDYTDPIELNCGRHSIAASMSGYTAYQGTIDADSDKIIKISLPESSSNITPAASEADSSGKTDTGVSDTGTSNTDTTSDTSGQSSDDTGDSGKQVADKEHSIYILQPSGASVYMDGDYQGKSPCHFTKVTGSHVLTFIKDGYKTESYTVEVSSDNKDAYFTFPNLPKSK